MKPETVYLPVKVEEDTNTGVFVKYIHSGHKYPVKEQKAFVFTPKQLNEYTKEVIKQALETAAGKAITKDDPYSYTGNTGSEYPADIIVDKESITKTAEETFKKFEV